MKLKNNNWACFYSVFNKYLIILKYHTFYPVPKFTTVSKTHDRIDINIRLIYS